MNSKIVLLRIATVPISINILLRDQLKFMRENGFEVHTATAAGADSLEFVEREGVVHHSIPMTRVISPLQDLVALVKLFFLIRKIKPSIVHTHTPKAGLLGMMAAFLCRVPVRMHTVAGMPIMEATGLARFILDQTEKLTYALAHRVYPNSLSLKDYVDENYSRFKSKIRVIANGSSNGIDTNYYSPQQFAKPISLPVDSFVFAYVGRLLKDKGTVELITAFTKLHEDHSNAHLLLIGRYEEDRDPLPIDIRDTISKHPAIHAAGFQTDVRPYLAMSQVFIFPSYREGFPNVVLQALCMNLPVIASNINGCDEMIQNGENGYLVKVKSAEALYEKMNFLLANTDVLDQLSRNARTSVVERYDRKIVWNSLLLEYTNLLNELPR